MPKKPAPDEQDNSPKEVPLMGNMPRFQTGVNALRPSVPQTRPTTAVEDAIAEARKLGLPNVVVAPGGLTLEQMNAGPQPLGPDLTEAELRRRGHMDQMLDNVRRKGA